MTAQQQAHPKARLEGEKNLQQVAEQNHSGHGRGHEMASQPVVRAQAEQNRRGEHPIQQWHHPNHGADATPDQAT